MDATCGCSMPAQCRGSVGTDPVPRKGPASIGNHDIMDTFGAWEIVFSEVGFLQSPAATRVVQKVFECIGTAVDLADSVAPLALSFYKSVDCYFSLATGAIVVKSSFAICSSEKMA